MPPWGYEYYGDRPATPAGLSDSYSEEMGSDDECEDRSLNERLTMGTTMVKPGNPAVSGAATELPAVPLLKVKGELVPLPLIERSSTLERLVSIASPSPHGKGMETVRDPAVRSSLELPGEEVTFAHPSWQSSLKTLLDRVADGLGCKDGLLSAEPYKLLLYRKGDHFLAHRDTEKAPGMVATLIVQLPSIYEGGELVVRYNGKSTTCDLGNGDSLAAQFECHFAAHYADVEHEVLSMKGGVRLAMVYSLIWTAPTTPRTMVSERGSVIAAAFEGWNEREGPKMFTLHHVYSRQGMRESLLKGADKLLWQEIATANRILPEERRVRASLAIVTRSFERHDGDEDDVTYGDVTAEVVFSTSEPSSALRRFSLRPKRQFVYYCPRRSYWSNFSTDSEYTGNEGANFYTTYTQCGIVVYPLAQEADILMRKLPYNQLPGILENARLELEKEGDDSVTATERARLEEKYSLALERALAGLNSADKTVLASFMTATKGRPEMLTFAERALAEKAPTPGYYGYRRDRSPIATVLLEYLLSVDAFIPAPSNGVKEEATPPAAAAAPAAAATPALPLPQLGPAPAAPAAAPAPAAVSMTEAASVTVESGAAPAAGSGPKPAFNEEKLTETQLARLNETFWKLLEADERGEWCDMLLSSLVQSTAPWELVSGLVQTLVTKYAATYNGHSSFTPFYATLINLTATYTWECMAPVWRSIVPKKLGANKVMDQKQMMHIITRLSSSTMATKHPSSKDGAISPHLLPVLRLVLPLLPVPKDEPKPPPPPARPKYNTYRYGYRTPSEPTFDDPFRPIFRTAAVAEDSAFFQRLLDIVEKFSPAYADKLIAHFEEDPMAEQWQAVLVRALAPRVISHLQRSLVRLGAFSWSMPRASCPDRKELEEFLHSTQTTFTLYGFTGAAQARKFSLPAGSSGTLQVLGQRKNAHIIIQKTRVWYEQAKMQKDWQEVAKLIDKANDARIAALTKLLTSASAVTPPPFARDAPEDTRSAYKRLASPDIILPTMEPPTKQQKAAVEQTPSRVGSAAEPAIEVIELE